MSRAHRLALSLPALVALAIAIAAGAADAQLKRAYFSNTPTSGGIRYGRSDFEAMPAEVKTFDLEKDKDVFLYVILDTADPVKVSGVLKDPNGRQHAKFDRDVDRYGRAVTGQTFWRSVNWRWSTERMRDKRGQWHLELTVNDKPAGSYAFTLK
jgi:hypothetical protein